MAPAIAEDLERAIRDVYGVELRQDCVPVRFASWVGGDMDGNPSVGAATIRASLERHMELALRRYQAELQGAARAPVPVDHPGRRRSEGVLERIEECRRRSAPSRG